MEKRRRARINESLSQLKTLILDALKKDVSNAVIIIINVMIFLGQKEPNSACCVRILPRQHCVPLGGREVRVSPAGFWAVGRAGGVRDLEN